jgi:hypothetical protein
MEHRLGKEKLRPRLAAPLRYPPPVVPLLKLRCQKPSRAVQRCKVGPRSKRCQCFQTLQCRRAVGRWQQRVVFGATEFVD